MSELKAKGLNPLGQNLLTELQQLADELGFTVKEMKSNLSNHYIPVDSSQGDRCVDDRRDKPIDNYPYDQGEYNGRQFPGGTFGIIGALRVVTGMKEKEAQDLVVRAYRKRGWKIGDHIDDEHGQITDLEKLEKRTKGCGNQDAIRAGKVGIYSFVAPEEVDSRFELIKRERGYLPVLTGEHEAVGAGINLKKGTTFNPKSAVPKKESIFNLDLLEVEGVAKELWQELDSRQKQDQTEESFVSSFLRTVIKDYLQTLAALNGPREIQYRI